MVEKKKSPKAKGATGQKPEVSADPTQTDTDNPKAPKAADSPASGATASRKLQDDKGSDAATGQTTAAASSTTADKATARTDDDDPRTGNDTSTQKTADPEGAGSKPVGAKPEPAGATGGTAKGGDDGPGSGASAPADPEKGTGATKSADRTAKDTSPAGEAVDQAKAGQTPPDRSARPAPDHTQLVAQPDPVVVRRGGFGAMLLGGVVAGAIGFGAAYLYFEYYAPADDALTVETLRADIAAQSDRLSGLAQDLQALADRPEGEPPDLSGLEASQADLDTRLDAVSGRIDDLQARLENQDAQPASAEGGISEAQFAALSNRIERQAEQIADINRIQQAREEAASASALSSLRRAGISRVQTALDSGAAFESALADLEAADVAVPDDLRAVAAEGVVTLSQLQSDFPDAARAALGAVRKGRDGTGGGFLSFMGDQLGVRSLEPREGSNPDAVLSRAEAALREGRLNDTLAEIQTLPEPALAEMSGWVERARTRLKALHAAETLAAEQN